MKIMPVAKTGKLSFWLAMAFVAGYIFTFFAAQLLYGIMGMLQVYLGIAIGAVGTAAGGVSLISLFKNHERSLLAFLSLLIGLYGIIFLSFLVWLTYFGGSLFSIGGGF